MCILAASIVVDICAFDQDHRELCRMSFYIPIFVDFLYVELFFQGVK